MYYKSKNFNPYLTLENTSPFIGIGSFYNKKLVCQCLIKSMWNLIMKLATYFHLHFNRYFKGHTFHRKSFKEIIEWLK